MAEVLRDRIVDAALLLAEECSWEALRLQQVAERLDITLNEVRAQFREKEELVDAWFDRADDAMLAEGEKPDVAALAPRARIQRLLLAWLAVLAPHRRATREMITGKLEPGHLHYQVAGLLRVSRTVQWLREAAQRHAVLPWRAIEEAGLTVIYLMTFAFWMRDDSEGSARTAAFLDRLLGRAESIVRCARGPRERRPAGATGQPTRSA